MQWTQNDGYSVFQDIVRSMGSGLLGPLIKEAVRKDRDPVHCEDIISYLVQVRTDKWI